MGQSLGLVEVASLLPAITIADAMVKTANIRLIAIESARGNGWMTVKIEGSVEAVSAAIDAGVVIAEGMNTMASKKIIARPDESVLQLFGLRQEMRKTESDIEVKSLEEIEVLQEIKEETEPREKMTSTKQEIEETEKRIELKKQDKMETNVAMCNLCLDPACSRVRGELRTDCIHWTGGKG